MSRQNETLKNVQFRSRASLRPIGAYAPVGRVRILTTGIPPQQDSIFRGLKFERNVPLRPEADKRRLRKGAFFKGLKLKSGNGNNIVAPGVELEFSRGFLSYTRISSILTRYFDVEYFFGAFYTEPINTYSFRKGILMGNKFKSSAIFIPIDQAVGTILAHDITEIRPGQFKGAAFKKGHIITGAELVGMRIGDWEVDK